MEREIENAEAAIEEMYEAGEQLINDAEPGNWDMIIVAQLMKLRGDINALMLVNAKIAILLAEK